MKIETVSLKLKYSGANITKDPLRKNKNWFKYELLSIRNWVSSLPKWNEATTKKAISTTVGKSIQRIIIVTASSK